MYDGALANGVGELLGLGPSQDTTGEGVGVWPITQEQEELVRERLRHGEEVDRPFAESEAADNRE